MEHQPLIGVSIVGKGALGNETHLDLLKLLLGIGGTGTYDPRPEVISPGLDATHVDSQWELLIGHELGRRVRPCNKNSCISP